MQLGSLVFRGAGIVFALCTVSASIAQPPDFGGGASAAEALGDLADAAVRAALVVPGSASNYCRSSTRKERAT